MLILGIETSNTILSVALVEDDKALIEITEIAKNNHSERLMPVIEQAFKEVGRTVNELDLIAVAEGPGSYTGIRIGVTVAKTLAWTCKIPLVGISSLEVLARNLSTDGIIVPLFDARRQTVFAAAYDGLTYQPLIPEGHYALENLLEKLKPLEKTIYFIGEDVAIYWEKIADVLSIKASRVETPNLNQPHATTLIKGAKVKEPIQNIHTFTPNYHRLPEALVNWMASQNETNDGQ